MNLATILKSNIDSQPSRKAIGYCKKGKLFHYNFFDYGQELRTYISAFKRLGIKHGDRVSIMGSNSIEWHLCDLSLMLLGAISIPIYPNTVESDVEDLIDKTDTKYFLCQDRHQFKHIINIAPKVINVILFEEQLFTTLVPKNILFLSDILNLSKDEILPSFTDIIQYTQPSDISTIVHTSGTTTQPKSTVFTQDSICSYLENISLFMKGKLSSSDSSFSHLPLSHILGRCDSLLHLSLPSHVIFGEGAKYFSTDLSQSSPSFFITVPRILEKMKERIEANINSKGEAFRKLYKLNRKISKNYHSKIAQNKNPSILEKKSYIYSQKYFFSNIRDQISNNIRFIVSGGAPLSRKLFYFFQDIGIPLLEGYGLTETLGPCTFNPFERPVVGSVGIALPNSQLRIAPDGEVLIKTPSLFSKYLKECEKNLHFTKDGFFKSGDIGYFDRCNYLYITDRKKDLIITSGGHNIAPQKIELLMCEEPHISNFLVVGDDKKYLCALVGIKKNDFKELFETGLLKSHLSLEEIASRPGIEDLIEMEIQNVNRSLAQFEKIRHFKILPIDLMESQQFSTSSGKLKKSEIFNKFAPLIDSMYQ